MHNYLDIVLDANVLSDVIAEFYRNSISTHGDFSEQYRISSDLCVMFNEILEDHREEGISKRGKLVASNFAFIEIARKFEEISDSRFSIDEFKAFIDSPPEWFVFEDLNTSLFFELENLPSHVIVGTGTNQKPIEWADAIHAATALLRGERSILATSDSSLKSIEKFRGRVFP